MKYKALIFLAFFLLVFALLAWQFTSILFYFIISAIVASILRPLTNYFSQTVFLTIRIPRFLAVLVSFTMLALVMALFVLLFIPIVSAQIDVLSRFSYDGVMQQFASPITSIEDFLIVNNLTDQPAGFLSESIRLGFVDFIQNTNLTAILNSILSYTGSFIIGIIAVIFITFFLLYEESIIRRKLIGLIPNSYFEMTIAAVAKIEMLLSNYLSGLLIQMISIFTLASVGLSLINVNFALTIALFAAVANLIPYLGPILGASFAVIVSISTSPETLVTYNDYLFLTAKILAVFGVVQLVDNILLQPFIFSKSVKAHPLEIFVAIFAGAAVADIPGMIAAIPVYTIVRVSLVELVSGFREYRVFRVT